LAWIDYAATWKGLRCGVDGSTITAQLCVKFAGRFKTIEKKELQAARASAREIGESIFPRSNATPKLVDTSFCLAHFSLPATMPPLFLVLLESPVRWR
jgi:hypothetical protein